MLGNLNPQVTWNCDLATSTDYASFFSSYHWCWKLKNCCEAINAAIVRTTRVLQQKKFWCLAKQPYLIFAEQQNFEWIAENVRLHRFQTAFISTVLCRSRRHESTLQKANDTEVAYLEFPAPGDKLSLDALTQLVRGSIKLMKHCNLMLYLHLPYCKHKVFLLLLLIIYRLFCQKADKI